MLNLHARAQIARLLGPVGRGLARTPLTPNVMTVAGTIGVAGGALGFFTRGSFFLGAVVVGACALTDLLDGTLARARGTSGPWGAFLDSTMDRVGDAAIFGSLVIWYAGRGHSLALAGAALASLAGGFVTSYAKARAESLGLTCNVGLAERAERLLVVLVAVALSGLGVPYLLAIALWLLAVVTVVTAGQRFAEVYRQVGRTSGGVADAGRERDRPAPAAGPGAENAGRPRGSAPRAAGR
jgi:CDP-diacylglycerol--glycerol-3-phosphate 3-phosphatidyltransferase